MQHCTMHDDEQVMWGDFRVVRPDEGPIYGDAPPASQGFVVDGGALYLYRRGEEWAQVSMGRTKERYRAPILLGVEAPGTWSRVVPERHSDDTGRPVPRA